MTYCAAFGCNNSTKKGGVGLHFFSFPKENERRKAWAHYCKRADFQPKAHHKLCSEHFSAEQLERNPERLAEFGYLNSKAKLKADALPDQPLNIRHAADRENKRPKLRGAFQKRRRAEVLQEILLESCVPDNSLDDDLSAELSSFRNEHGEITIPSQNLDSTNCSHSPVIDVVSSRTVKIQACMKLPQRTRNIQVGSSFINKPPQPKLRSVGVQCSLLEAELRTLSKPQQHNSTSVTESDSESESDEECITETTDDQDYDPMDEEYSSDEDKDEDGEMETVKQVYPLRREVSPEDENQYLVSESALADLLSCCLVCGCEASTFVEITRGTLIMTKTVCIHGHERQWQSQPCHKGLPWSNLLVAGAILFSGSNAAKSLRLMRHMKLQMFSQSTYSRLQAYYSIPSCVVAWKDHQTASLQSIQQEGRSLVLGGDGRCDSPGYSAKYRCYTLMDLECNKILDFQLVQSNEVKGSCHMELEGMKRCLNFLGSQELTVKDVVTDRHCMVKKYMRVSHPDKQHFFDVWHVTKGISKKLEAKAKQKGCESLRPWIKSITNHCYWIAASSGRHGELKVDRWKTISQHVTNKHITCEHGNIDGPRSWLKSGSRPHKLLVEVVEMKSLLADIPKLSPLHQTYGLEVYHSVLNNFAPKNTHFYYSAFTARICLAALHFNENGKREQAVRKDGFLRWQVAYPKGKKGEAVVVKPVRTSVTFNYAITLRRVLVERRRQFDTYRKAAADAVVTLGTQPPPLTTSFQHVPKDTLIKQRRSRYAV